MRQTSNVIWQDDRSWFGGFSGVEVSAQGRRITLITDRGHLVVAQMIRHGGSLQALQITRQQKLRNRAGKALKGDFIDAEGLAVAPDGRAFVSFERKHRVMRLDFATGRTTGQERQGFFAGLQFNSGLETLAIDAHGVLHALPERSGDKGRPFPVFTFRQGRWLVTARIPRRGPFLPVGADFDSTGRFYLLERATTPLGFRSRIRRFDLTADNLAEEILLTTGPGRLDNMEAIATWRDAADRQMLTLVSDDNFLSIQRTQIVEFALSE